MGSKKSLPAAKRVHAKQQLVPKSFLQRHARLWKGLLCVLAGLVLLVLAIFIWFRLSPWPGAMVIRYVFEKGGAKTAVALDKHAPAGIAVLSNQEYKPGDKDAKLDVYIPESAQQSDQKLPVIIWTHGGAWLSGGKTDAAAYYKLIAGQGFVVIAPNYSLAPDYTYPTPIHQLNTMHAFALENADRFHADTSKIILAGDSAGSQLSAQMAALITNDAYAQEVGITPALKSEQLKGVVLTCGIYKMEELAYRNPTLSKIIGWGDDVTVWAYSGTNDFSDPIIRQMSPYYHVTKDFPSTFITGGNGDPLTDVQSKSLADKLQSLGVGVTRLFYESGHTPALPHEYQFNLDADDGQKAFQQITVFMHERTQ
jgi:acetyl esterase/lipase